MDAHTGSLRARSGRAVPRRAASSADRNAAVRERIIAAAEELFADRGFDATSLRDITEVAKANVASVNYHFGSKEQLVRQVLSQRMLPYIAHRAASLDRYLADLGSAPPTVEGVAEAMIRPMTVFSRDGEGGRLLIRLLLQVRAQPTNESMQMFEHRVDPIAHRFIDAFKAAAPGLDEAQVYWRYNFSVGAAMQVLADADPVTRRLKRLSGGLCDTDDDEATIQALVRFISGGFRAP